MCFSYAYSVNVFLFYLWRFQGSDSATPKEKITNENLEKKETDKLLSVQAQEQTVSNENLEKKEFGDLPKPVQEQTESNEKQENKDD